MNSNSLITKAMIKKKANYKCLKLLVVCIETNLMHLYEFLEWNLIAKDAGFPLFVSFLFPKPFELSGLEPLVFTEDALLF